MNMAGQSINDRLTAARYSLAGQGLAKSVCKATTEEVIGPKKKHLDYLLHCTNEPNVSIPQLANLLIERTQQQSWVIVYKALITVHHMMCYGNERFTQYLASSNCNFNLGGFLDKTGVAGQSHPQLSYDMSTFIRRYAKYINEKAVSYRTVAFDFCKVKRGKDDGTLRTMPTETLLKTLPVLQAQLDALLDFDCTANELTNGVINSAFMLLFRDLIRLFACYNDGIINLLEKYFEMNKKQARDALDCYKKFLIRMDRVSEFLKVAECVGIDRGEIPDLTKAPSSLLDALEAHLASLEGKKVPVPGSATPASKVNIGDAVSALNSTSVSFGWVSSNGRMGEPGTLTNNGTEGAAASPPVDELAKRQALAEEEAMYEKLRTEHSKNNPFLSSPTSETAPAVAAATTTAASNNGESSTILDLFGSADTAQNAEASTKASDDLLQLAGNPFADMLTAPAPAPAAAPAPVTTQQQPYTNGFSHPPAGSGFVTSNAFDAVFGNSSTGPSQTFDGFGDILKPEGGLGGGDAGMALLAGSQPVAPLTTAAPTNVTASGKIISGDLDMSLSSLVDNLNIKGAPTQKPGQWNSPKAQGKTGGAGWTPAAPTAAMGAGGFRPGMPATGAAQPQPAFPGGFPQQQQMPSLYPIGMGIGMQPQQTASAVPQQPSQTTATPFDPFGGL